MAAPGGYDVAAAPPPPPPTSTGGPLSASRRDGADGMALVGKNRSSSPNNRSSSPNARGGEVPEGGTKSTESVKSSSSKGSHKSGASGKAKKVAKDSKTAEETASERGQKEALKIVGETFAVANRSKAQKSGSAVGEGEDGDPAAYADVAAAKAKEETKKSGGWSMFGSRKKDDEKGKEGVGQESSSSKGSGNELKIPDSFEGMVRFNAGMVGANMAYIEVMLRSFQFVVADVCSVGTIEEQTDFLALEIRREVTGDVKTSEFKTCLFSSLAALIPKMWNAKTEQAWGWFWDSLDAQLQESLLHAAVHEKKVISYVKGLQKADFDSIGTILWKKLFAQEKEAEMQHKQPTATFVRIAMLAVQFSCSIFEDPTRMKSEITQHALKHILHQVEIRLFTVFCEMMEVEIREHSKDEAVTAGMFWALSVIASLMARVMKQASNPVLVAAVKGNVAELKKALQVVSRGERANAVLYA